jgi:hypothetical protein
VKPDRRRPRAVVLESDDWGLCAWCPDGEARRALARWPAFLQGAGPVYGGSTLESAADVRALRELLLGFRGADGAPPVLQANTVLAAPDYDRLARDGIPAVGEPPLVVLPATPSRWARPGLWDEVRLAIDAGVWRPELHGLHHLPAHAWLGALRRGAPDARAALEQQSPICEAAQSGGEYGPDEPASERSLRLGGAFAAFRTLFGRAPFSFCPPDYLWDAALERHAAALGVGVLQGDAERAGALNFVRRRLPRRWPRRRNGLLLTPRRIAFEPRGDASGGGRLGAARAHRAARAAWARGEPAIVSTHRHNYASLDSAWSDAGRAALADLLARLCADGAVFLTDARMADTWADGAAT